MSGPVELKIQTRVLGYTQYNNAARILNITEKSKLPTIQNSMFLIQKCGSESGLE